MVSFHWRSIQSSEAAPRNRRKESVKFLGITLLLTLSLTGCEGSHQIETPVEQGGMTLTLTWQEAKAATQLMELEIASIIPEEFVVDIAQNPQGVMLSCSSTEHNWNGRARVSLKPGIPTESILRRIQSHYDESDVVGSIDLDIMGDERLQLVGIGGESYLIGFEAADTIYIASGSACFNLPDGVYPGGDF